MEGRIASDQRPRPPDVLPSRDTLDLAEGANSRFSQLPQTTQDASKNDWPESFLTEVYSY